VSQGRNTGLSSGRLSRHRSSRTLACALVSAVTLAFSGVIASGAAADASTPAQPPAISGLFNQRYCEILAVGGATPDGFPVTIYNTIGINDCPPEIWDSLDFRAIAASEGLLAASPNGPRRWLIDAVRGTVQGEPKDLGGLMMRPVASLVTKSLAPEPFTETMIARDNSWIFRKGRRIHEVVSPTGSRYVMQAYTNTVDPGLNLKTLASVGSNPLAAIPAGWKFRTRKLKRTLVVKSNGMATIVRDGLRCVYQKYTPPKRKRR
jgi:hypothetical protein